MKTYYNPYELTYDQIKESFLKRYKITEEYFNQHYTMGTVRGSTKVISKLLLKNKTSVELKELGIEA